MKRCLASNQVQPRFNTPPTRLTCVDFICRPRWSCLHVHEEEEGRKAGGGGGGGQTCTHTQAALPSSLFPPSFPGPNHMSDPTHVPYPNLWILNFVTSTSNCRVKELDAQMHGINLSSDHLYRSVGYDVGKGIWPRLFTYSYLVSKTTSAPVFCLRVRSFGCQTFYDVTR